MSLNRSKKKPNLVLLPIKGQKSRLQGQGLFTRNKLYLEKLRFLLLSRTLNTIEDPVFNLQQSAHSKAVLHKSNWIFSNGCLGRDLDIC
jgi:hypothetical protein